MDIIKTKLEGCYIIEPKVWNDARGWFYESYSERELKKAGINIAFVQDNHSMSDKKGILRGLHLQNSPHAQAKLVRCTRGAILDVAVDLRADSATYKRWVSVMLSAENKKQLLIPHGFAHGFLTLTDDVEVNYKADNFYNKESEVGIIYNDKEIGIDWGIDNPIMSDKDAKALPLSECDIKW